MGARSIQSDCVHSGGSAAQQLIEMLGAKTGLGQGFMNVGFVASNRANAEVLGENGVNGDKNVINSGIWQLCALKCRKVHR